MISGLGRFVLCSLEFLQSQQLFSGEVLCVRKQPNGSVFNCPCPIASAFVYDFLSFVDPADLACQWRVMDFLPFVQRRTFTATIASLRWRLRTYILWEQNSDSTWRFYGRQSSLEPDLATTAYASTILLGRNAIGELVRQQWKAQSLLGNDNLYASAQLLRFLVLAGFEAQELILRVCSALQGTEEISPFVLQAVARAWSTRQISQPEAVTEMLVSRLLQTQPNGRLEKALIISALLDLDFVTPKLDEAVWTALADVHPPAEWPHEPFSEAGVGSPAVTAALTLANTVRVAARSTTLWR